MEKKSSKIKFESHLFANIPEAPTFKPSVEEFKNPITYIESIRPIAEKFGICKIIPPDEYEIECVLSLRSFKFKTKIQNIHQLQKRDPSLKRKESPSFTPGIVTRKRKIEEKESPSKCAWTNEQEQNFGYQYSQTEFSLSTFSKMAEQFEHNYFDKQKKQPSKISVLPKNALRKLARQGGKTRILGQNYFLKGKDPSLEDIELEYWKIIESGLDPVSVHYGSDLDVISHGSGYPKTYKSDWNLNKLPIMKDSLLHYLNQLIPGISSPMIYVGMMFSSFCWHTEDNYLYSTNFIHNGAPKTWYGVPSSSAAKFEKVMREQLPELFNYQPNLLHSLVTQLSPRILKENNIPIYKLTHSAGEYVITFPQAYHAGFNNGFNIAESVNFALPNWLAFGRLAVDNYTESGRSSAFSHDQLVYNAALETKELPFEINEIIKIDFDSLLKKEKKLREIVNENGIKKENVLMVETAREKSNRKSKPQKENVLCVKCKQDCFFSAIGCSCTKSISCLQHFKDLCSCQNSQKFIIVKHTIKHLESVLSKM